MTIDGLLDGPAGGALLAVGAPCSGKTTFAREALMAGLRRYGESKAVMTVSGRQTADRIGDGVIRELGASAQARPVTTLSAVAFRCITDERKREELPLPRLLNGAEQDALLKSVCEAHVRHVRAGDPCDTCALMREYFAVSDWTSVLANGSDAGDGAAAQPSGKREDADGDASDGRARIGVNDAFVMQLRDMLARMDELGASSKKEGTILAALGQLGHWSPHTERLHVQWRLAFALRREYRDAVDAAYPGEYRLDSSRLLVEGAEAVRRAATEDLPELLVADDFQDLTLAGFAFLQALHDRGVRLLLVGNPDEAVQTFRGSYPEYLFAQAADRLGATVMRLEGERRPAYSYRDLAASRVSLSIHSAQDDPVPVPMRPGKLPQLPGSLPIAALDDIDPLPDDGTLTTALYRSPKDEMEDIIWRIKQTHVTDGRSWNDMAVIAHDNTTVRTLGERLRHDGVPVRYSSVTRPLKDEPFVQGLFALLELADLRNQAFADLGMNLQQTAVYVRSRVATLMACPLISVGGGRDHEGYPARLASIESAMNALASLSGVVDDGAAPEEAASETQMSAAQTQTAQAPTPVDSDVRDSDDRERMGHTLRGLLDGWKALRSVMVESRPDLIAVDDSMVDVEAPQGDDMPFGVDAMYLLLEFCHGEVAADSSKVTTNDVIAAIQDVCGRDPNAKAFADLWNLVDTVAKGLRSPGTREPQYALSLAWDASGVAPRWQREAFNNTDAGRAANDRLDSAMRLFSYASGSAASRNLPEFFAQVRAMRIEADSLAKVAPIDEAVTLTTPAGSAGNHWPLVWIPAVQQGVWPNLAARNTMFGGEDLADVMLYGALADEGKPDSGQLEAVLYAEQKSLLVALTRASERTSISAVYNDDLTPSDFLYGYLPERYDRGKHASAEGRDYAEVGGDDRFHGLDANPRGLVAAARVELAAQPAESDEARDARAALSLLAAHGVQAADAKQWPFVGSRSAPSQYERHEQDSRSGQDASSTLTAQHMRLAPVGESPTRTALDMPSTVTLSPSAVDGIWGCPVCWMLENRFSGPRPGSVATAFGSLIHAVAEQASNEGLDRADYASDLPVDERVGKVRDRMIAIYHELKGDAQQIADAADRYNASRKEKTVTDVLERIADYFVLSNTADYPAGNVKNFSVGTLEDSQCERSFAALFGLDDVLAAYNATAGVTHISRGELAAIMGTLVGGWPEGMSEDLRVRLSGRIDRLEVRSMANGETHVRLIDYKTGGMPGTKAIFNDLQLVCYQLGLVFPEDGPRGAQALQSMPDIAQSGLFHVAEKSAPATSKTSNNQEGLFQPALFHDGSLNDTTFVKRTRSSFESLADIPILPDTPPHGVSATTWQRFLSLRGTQAIWSLTMISRVFYAAAASRSTHLEAHPTADHVGYCRMRSVCPACAKAVNTVFETRQA
ncbi:PD-(D/E)XK nuclease family protein [Bifidobacterium leontopitheci]|uniref:PD-(D/E)XK nuclease superfamily n=1 Tax=Bifidobacterium leontopitheci TaxID=2650774 RepID=A0A6I1GKK7_9BIFI|nr:PD-(D/E)XK nuclease family protein [Bifidobacterium leontopitheci]KAB7790176.1 PD-(D/E)XK nuclease superfamily [Bifidobacterium leontopitheci]